MTRGALAGAAAVLATSLVLAADESWLAPATESARPNPVAATDAVRKRGAALYGEHCAMCHGQGGKGDGPSARLHAVRAKPPEDLTKPEVQSRMTDGEIFWKVSTGWRQGSRVVMPRFDEKVPDEKERWAIVHPALAGRR